MELMAVPKKKVSRHKRGIGNGPKALKPIPVIVRCRQMKRRVKNSAVIDTNSSAVVVVVRSFRTSSVAVVTEVIQVSKMDRPAKHAVYI